MKVKITFLLLFIFSCTAFAQCYTAAYTAYGTTIARRTDGTLWAKGFNFNGTAGTGNTVQQPNYIQIGTDNDWSENFCIGDTHALAVKNDGTLWVWGKNTNGCLGLGLSTLNTIVTPTQIGTDNDWAFVAADEKNSAAIKTNSTLWTWGDNQSGQLGIGSTVNFNQLAPIQAGSDNNWAKVFSNDSTYFAIKADGTLWAWGSVGTSNCKLGYIATNPALDYCSPHQVGTATNWISIAVGQNMAIGLQANGMLWAWGGNSTSQFGNGTANGTPTVASIPIQLGNDSDWQQISMSNVLCVALKNNGTRWGWGTNGGHQLGNGLNGNVVFPIQLDSHTDWAFISIDTKAYQGGNGLKQDQSLFIWGYDLAISAPRPFPVQEGISCPLANYVFNDVIHLVAFPNPVNVFVTIRYQLDRNMPIMLQLNNNLGQQILNKEFIGVSGRNELNLFMKNFSSGLYFINLKTESGTYECKVIKN